ncbi:PrsW family intramembrane metalloprotease [Candidatus Bathyarchaeota archaeon]|nr:PrsW family intramembrane metalloprotease [Candidatus Bathyarchaeota archaeon]
MEHPSHDEPPHCVIPLHKPSIKEFIFFFASGILVSIPFAAFFESAFPNTALFALLLIVVGAPFIEEIAKVFPLFYRHGETERSIVTLGLLIGLGFGIAEFFQYIVIVGTPPIARIPGIIFHASSTTITAYGIAKKRPLPYYLTAVFLHFANNFLAVTGALLSALTALLVLIVTFLLAWRYWHRAKKDLIVT